MTTMTINIINPVINLFSDLRTTSDSCRTIFEFDIKGSPNGLIKVDIERVGGTVEDYEKAEVNLTGRWFTSEYATDTHLLRGSGEAKFKLAIGNADLVVVKNDILGKCNETKITITDLTSGETESRNFSRCREGDQCDPNTPPPATPPTINKDTNIIVYYSALGSTTLDAVRTAKDTLLKDALIQYYGSDTVYHNKVKIVVPQLNSTNERAYENPYEMLGNQDKNVAGKLIVLTYVDQADTFAVPGYTNAQRTPNHDTFLQAYRTKLDNYPTNYYQGVLFQVATPDSGGDMIAFRQYAEAVKLGTSAYAGENGLSDRSEVNIKLDVTVGGTAQYYKDLIITSLNELGYTL